MQKRTEGAAFVRYPTSKQSGRVFTRESKDGTTRSGVSQGCERYIFIREDNRLLTNSRNSAKID